MGLFWIDPKDGDVKRVKDGRKTQSKAGMGTRPKGVGGRGPRIDITRNPPPVPDTGWSLPTEYPRLGAAKRIAIDTETKDPDLGERGPGTHRGDAHLVGISVATDDGHKWYLPFAHESGENLPKDQVLRWAKDELTRPNQRKLFFSGLYDLEHLKFAGVDIPGPYDDVKVAEPLIDELARSYHLDDIAHKYLGRGKTTTVAETWAREAFGNKIKDWRNYLYLMDPKLVGPYAEDDAYLLFDIFDKQQQEMASQDLLRVYDVECRLLPMLLGMRMRGVRVDLEYAEGLREELIAEQESRLAALKAMTGIDPAIWEPENIAQMLDKLGIPYPRTKKTDRPSVTAKWLESLNHPFGALLRRARVADRMLVTFVEGHILSNAIGDRIFTQFHPLKTDENGTVSGRLSSSNPNLQNIPIRDKAWGPKLRRVFVPDRGEDWGARDWSQVEYRLMVHYAALIGARGVEKAVEAYRHDRTTDFHKMVAELTGLERGDAKNFNFGMVYGQGLALTCSILGISVEEGKKLRDIYFERAPYIKEIAKSVQRHVDEIGYVRTYLGRRRRFPYWEDQGSSGVGKKNRKNQPLYNEWAPGRQRAFTYAALNGLIQGSAADLMKLAMVQYWEDGVSHELGAPLLTVHDELDFSVPRTTEGKQALEHVTWIMENCAKLEVPLIAEGGEGANWADAK